MSRQQWRNRITGEADVDPRTLTPHPHNWRLHGEKQAEVLRGVLDEVGWVQRVIVNQRTGHIIDGHLRVAQAIEHQESVVPVLYVDLDEGQEALALATLDPIAGLAATGTATLATLLETVTTGQAAVQSFLAEIAQQQGIIPPDFQPDSVESQGKLDQKQPMICPHCGEAFTP